MNFRRRGDPKGRAAAFFYAGLAPRATSVSTE